jgi:hypothetical protein
VKIGENGITIDDILVHDAHSEDNTVQLKLALMEGPDFPIALGVIRDVEAPTYDEAVAAQIEEIKVKKPYHTFEELLLTNDIINGFRTHPIRQRPMYRCLKKSAHTGSSQVFHGFRLSAPLV